MWDTAGVSHARVRATPPAGALRGTRIPRGGARGSQGCVGRWLRGACCAGPSARRGARGWRGGVGCAGGVAGRAAEGEREEGVAGAANGRPPQGQGGKGKVVVVPGAVIEERPAAMDEGGGGGKGRAGAGAGTVVVAAPAPAPARVPGRVHSPGGTEAEAEAEAGGRHRASRGEGLMRVGRAALEGGGTVEGAAGVFERAGEALEAEAAAAAEEPGEAAWLRCRAAEAFVAGARARATASDGAARARACVGRALAQLDAAEAGVGADVSRVRFNRGLALALLALLAEGGDPVRVAAYLGRAAEEFEAAEAQAQASARPRAALNLGEARLRLARAVLAGSVRAGAVPDAESVRLGCKAGELARSARDALVRASQGSPSGGTVHRNAEHSLATCALLLASLPGESLEPEHVPNTVSAPDDVPAPEAEVDRRSTPAVAADGIDNRRETVGDNAGEGASSAAIEEEENYLGAGLRPPPVPSAYRSERIERRAVAAPGRADPLREAEYLDPDDETPWVRPSPPPPSPRQGGNAYWSGGEPPRRVRPHPSRRRPSSVRDVAGDYYGGAFGAGGSGYRSRRSLPAAGDVIRGAVDLFGNWVDEVEAELRSAELEDLGWGYTADDVRRMKRNGYGMPRDTPAGTRARPVPFADGRAPLERPLAQYPGESEDAEWEEEEWEEEGWDAAPEWASAWSSGSSRLSLGSLFGLRGDDFWDYDERRDGRSAPAQAPFPYGRPDGAPPSRPLPRQQRPSSQNPGRGPPSRAKTTPRRPMRAVDVSTSDWL